MARYLNPAKIGLLALIELYTEEAVPSDAVLPVLSFVTSHILDHGHAGSSPTPEMRWSKAERTVGLVITVKDFERLLGTYPFLMGMPGRTLWDQFLTKLWDINSLDALHSFFERISMLLSNPKEARRRSDDDESHQQDSKVKLSRNSPFGAFVRRARLEFQRLRFHDCTELWRDFVRYRQPTAQYLRRKNPAFGRLSFDNVLLLGEKEEWNLKGVTALAAVAYGDMLTGDESGTIPVSTDDIEVLLEFQIEQMQKFGNRIPLEIRHQFQDLLRDSFLVPSLTHYLSFLDAWRAGDYTTAFDYLHRYFDYTMQHRDRLFYQYALMNLAVLQADFGCHQEAVSAMLETVSTARENRDMTCLNFALNWLFHFGRAHPDLVRDLESNSLLGTGKESLAFLRVKAKESGMWTLWSSVLLSEAKVALINGDSVATSLEYLVRSSQIIVERNLKSMFGSQLSLYAALWNRLGLAHLSSLTSDTFLRCHARHSVFDDELKHTCRIALALAERGKYDEGLEKLDGLDQNSLRSWKPSQYWHKYRGIIKLKKDLHHNNLDGARQLLDQLLQSKVDDLEPDMAFLIDSMHIDYLSRRGDLQAAFEEVNRLTLKLQDENRDIALRVKLLLLKVSLLDKCGRPQRAFSTAVRAANIAWRARLIPCLWQAIGAVSNILVSLAEFDAAAQLLVAVLPRALECGVLDVAAQLYSFLADANMGLAGTMQPRSSKRTEYMTRAMGALQKAFDHYSAVEDIERQCETMAKRAAIMRMTGDVALSTDYTAAYNELLARAVALRQGLR
ncbi:anaphase-promoting complex subunit 5 domain-containing protein [Hirsutella rhossiliensis]|uniref:Anaphase-promoting complex subunit 5 n=1 Tax=Hirsutella rhossiliensis TaxID=111463 RepID=A0A9P8MZY1_9HYPO|nr:anaphase-promoting complex subunit 5 domain-containing protein [Hirsutella rhossiliensis]KAH0964367.1 anaphase-promoting complex subunit 5 domain-containing protein [Hirsutella rhossiliensis]